LGGGSGRKDSSETVPKGKSGLLTATRKEEMVREGEGVNRPRNPSECKDTLVSPVMGGKVYDGLESRQTGGRK